MGDFFALICFPAWLLVCLCGISTVQYFKLACLKKKQAEPVFFNARQLMAASRGKENLFTLPNAFNAFNAFNALNADFRLAGGPLGRKGLHIV